MIRTAYQKIYDELIDEKKMFPRKHHLFVFGLAYGLLYNLRSEEPLRVDITRINQIKDRTTKDIIDFVFLLLNKDEKEEKLFDDMLRIADGGVREIRKVLENSKDFNIQNLIIDAEKIWQNRLSEFDIDTILKAQ